MEGFSVLRVCFQSTGGSSSIHSIYCKVHSVKRSSESTPNGRTLFTLGWPPYVDSSCLEELFSRAGNVVDVILQARGASNQDCVGFKVGYVVMSCNAEVTSTLKLCSSDTPIPCSTCPVGLTLFCRQYSQARPSVEALERSVAMAMNEYDMQVEEAKKERMKASQPDEDGWITVTRKRRKLADERPQRKKGKKKKLVNFYSWQLRESQREEIAKLRERFEEDKQRVANLRAARRFRPY